MSGSQTLGSIQEGLVRKVVFFSVMSLEVLSLEVLSGVCFRNPGYFSMSKPPFLPLAL